LERNLLNLPYEFVVCSEADRKYVGDSNRVLVVPNGFEQVSAPPTDCPVARPPIFLFVGTMCYEPNVDAVKFFATAILPLIRRFEPTARFLIVGHDPTETVLALKSIPGITVTGTVASVEKYLYEATVFVAPIRFGGGTRIKILEAMAHGKAVVSTTIGAEGLEVESGTHLLLADGPTAFSESCLLLLNNASLRGRLSKEGRSLINNQYTWNRIERHVEDIVRSRSTVAKALAKWEVNTKCLSQSR
jgi:glycosyltransferase involved in cell wall biosynthesis